MRRVLVPLDGSELAESILPDARRLAGTDGTLILIRTSGVDDDPGKSQEYLDLIAERMRPQHTEAHALAHSDPAVAIDRAIMQFRADMVALATHGRDLAGIWQHGGVAWRAAARSTVPVLLRHGGTSTPTDVPDRRILVPLDGSPLAEQALPLAAALADEWGASLWPVRIVAKDDPMVDEPGATLPETESYLRSLAETLRGDIHVEVRSGRVVDSIAAIAAEQRISDIVMTTHGRTGVTRVLIGGVAEELIHRLDLPIVVIPALVALAAP
jgi:nucleotide-binding universal stress UspA family protein